MTTVNHPEDLADLARRLHPRAVVPIHTEAASYWPLHAARSLGVDMTWPPQYERAKPL